MEAIHIELTNERMNIPMSEESGKYFLLKSLNVLDGKFLTGRQPLNNMFKVRLLNEMEVTSRISYVFLMKRATECSILSDFIDFLFFRFN